MVTVVFRTAHAMGAAPFVKDRNPSALMTGLLHAQGTHFCFSKQGPSSTVVVDLGTLILAWLGFIFLIAGPRQGVILITNYALYF